MSLRGRIASLVALTVTSALVVVGIVLQGYVASVLVGEVDEDLRAIAASVERDPRGVFALATGRGRLGGAAGLVQIVDRIGTVQTLRGPLGRAADPVRLPVDATVLEVARGDRGATMVTVEVEGVRSRMLIAPLGGALTLQVARPIDEVDTVIARVRRGTALAALVGALVASLLAWGVAGRSLRPVHTLIAEVESVRGSRDLARRPAGGPLAPSQDGADPDEVGRLARAFDDMLARLDAARVAQELLAADAAHELRTPLTSLRTNVEVLARDAERLSPADRSRLMEDLIGQLDEMTAMVDGLVELARVDAAGTERRRVDLVALARDVVDAARRRHPARAGDLALTDAAGVTPLVVADEREVALALAALIDNAVKYAESGPIVVTVDRTVDARVGAAATLEVRDEGPGVDAAELGRIFQRFHRGAQVRSMPGAGLGLSLVARVAEACGGRAEARSVDPHGLAVRMVLPVARAGEHGRDQTSSA
jgi:two-component system, OmpR family, sensor histidine kinase MprB